jgi:hypothetical protein
MSDIFIITSVINTGTKPWSYTNIRSAFSKEERFAQTLQTIHSIKTYHPNSRIILVECSEIEDYMTDIFKNNVFHFIQTVNIPDVNYACLETNKKGFGEVLQIREVFKYIKQNNIIFNRLCK